jgi:heptosyltransferase III
LTDVLVLGQPRLKEISQKTLAFQPLPNIIAVNSQMRSTPKILAIQFKYLGDAVLMTPALRAIRRQFPQGELHLLAPEETAPLFEHLPYLNRLWPMPRRRGRASLAQTWPMIRALRRERFDRSVDFASNDRGAIVSFVVGAKDRLGWDEPGGFWGRKFCYTRRIPLESERSHESIHLAHLLSGWNISPSAFEPEIYSDPALVDAATKILPYERAIVCHLASSQPNRQWPLQHWAKLHRLVGDAGRKIVFTTARGEREQLLVTELLKLAPDATVLPLIPGLALFLAVLRRAGIFISGDTGPLHFAAGLGVPTISLFGPSSPVRWAPIGPRHQILTGASCSCNVHSAVCHGPVHCLSAISPEQVLACLDKVNLEKI